MGSPRSVVSHDVNCQTVDSSAGRRLNSNIDSKVRSVEIRQGNLLSLIAPWLQFDSLSKK